MKHRTLTYEAFCALVTDRTGYPKAITPGLHLDSDIGCTGDDAVEFLEAVEETFGVDFEAAGGMKEIFSLADDEYLFYSEPGGCIDIRSLARGVLRRPTEVVRDPTIAELYRGAEVALNKSSSD